jgi:hypothetical protein
MIVIIFKVSIFLFLIPRANIRHLDPAVTYPKFKYPPIRPELLPTKRWRPDPIKWLQQNSNDNYAISEGSIPI